MMKRFFLFISFCIVSYSLAYPQTVQYTQIFDKAIKTLEIKVDGYDFSNPVIALNSPDVLKISFDELSFDFKNYSYKIEHCNADWTLSNISEFDYINGINLNDIIDYRQSINTTFDYTHYVFYIPNENIRPTISGNYIISVFDNNNPNHIFFKVRLSVVDEKTNITGVVKANTDLGIKTKYQQIDFDVITRDYQVQDPFSEIKVYIRQNGRIDNEVTDIKPTYLMGNKLSYSNNRATIFEGGNEYRSLEISNIRILDDNVKDIIYANPYYHVEMFGDVPRNKKAYSDIYDVNGKYVINLQNNHYDKELEADYMFVHFVLPMDPPFFNGNIYLAGGFNFQMLNEQSRMQYMNDSKSYEQTLILKQGGYNYQYLFVPKGSVKGSSEPIEGSYWETENEYEIFIYHRPPGCRYDKLIGYKILNSR